MGVREHTMNSVTEDKLTQNKGALPLVPINPSADVSVDFFMYISHP